MAESTRDQEAVAAVRKAFDLGAFTVQGVNSGRGWSAAKQQKLERGLRAVLRIVLDREPTDDEIRRAGASDD